MKKNKSNKVQPNSVQHFHVTHSYYSLLIHRTLDRYFCAILIGFGHHPMKVEKVF